MLGMENTTESILNKKGLSPDVSRVDSGSDSMTTPRAQVLAIFSSAILAHQFCPHICSLMTSE